MVTLTASAGNPDLFVTDVPGALPDFSAPWRSNTLGASDSVRIPGPHATDSVYTIGVWSSGAVPGYTILAQTEGEWMYLRSGVPQRHFVATGNNERFVYTVEQPTCDVSIAIISLNGDPDVLVGHSSLNSLPHHSSTRIALE